MDLSVQQLKICKKFVAIHKIKCNMKTHGYTHDVPYTFGVGIKMVGLCQFFLNKIFISFFLIALIIITLMPSAVECKQQLEATCAEWLQQEMEEKLQEEQELQEIEEEERWEEEKQWRREEEERQQAEEARIVEEMHQAMEEEDKAAEEAWKAAADPGFWEERIQVLQLETEAEAAKSGSVIKPSPHFLFLSHDSLFPFYFYFWIR